MMAKKRTDLEAIDWMRSLLAFLLIGAFIGAMATFTILPVPDSNKDVLTYMIGQLSGMATTILAFYFVNKVGQDAIDAKRTENTAKAFDAIAAAQQSTPPPHEDAAAAAADQVANAAQSEADNFRGG